MPALSVIVPCLDERENLGTLVSHVRPVLERYDGELVLVDDGSTDGSFDDFTPPPNVIVCRHARNQGIPQAWSTGLAASTGAWVASLDADLQYEPRDLGTVLDHARANGFDFVQGARRRLESEGPVRTLLSRGLNGALNAAFGTSALDHKSALFVCRREHLATLLLHRHRFRHWQCFIGVSARALGLRCDEVPVPFRPRARGVSAFGRIPLKSTLEVMADFAPAVRLYGFRTMR